MRKENNFEDVEFEEIKEKEPFDLFDFFMRYIFLWLFVFIPSLILLLYLIFLFYTIITHLL